MNCNQFNDLFELYALGALDPTEAEALREHLDTGCRECSEKLRVSLQNAALLSASVPKVEPPARLRRKIEATFLPTRPNPVRMWFPWLVAAAALVALVTTIGIEQQKRSADSARIAAVSDEAQRMSHVLEIAQAPGTKQLPFGAAQHDAPQGSLFIHQKLGVALTMENLPAAPEGWKYESWVVPKQGSPQPVESFPVLTGRRAVTVVPGPVDVSEWTSVAVSMEPIGSQPTKPTKIVFSAPV